MGHSENQGRRRLTLPLPLRAKMTGLAIFICGFMGLITSAQLDPITARVERVIDGDTIHVRVEGKRYTVRLIGVDTPETKHPTKPVQYFGREASDFTKAALEGKTVMLQKDRTGDTVDRYGRWLRYVLLDGDNFNARLIRDGYAHAYRAQGSVAMGPRGTRGGSAAEAWDALATGGASWPTPPVFPGVRVSLVSEDTATENPKEIPMPDKTITLTPAQAQRLIDTYCYVTEPEPDAV